MNKILLIDDNLDIQDANAEYLSGKGYQVDLAMNSAQALAHLQSSDYDCVVLDVMLPDLDGFQVCAAARRRETTTPIIFLSCLDGEDSRIRGLMAGGDDYMTKPYSVRELAARIHAQIRRSEVYDGAGSGVRSPQPGVMARHETRTIAIQGIHLVLSRREYDVLALLVDRAGEIVHKAELLSLLDDEEATLFTCVRRIRGKLSIDPALGGIETVFGEGYRYVPGGLMP